VKESNKKYLIVLTGPTAVGKTSLSFKLQKELGGSIISADSRQVYKEMTIGSAKPSKEEINKYNIKTCDYVSVTEDYNVGIFEKDALACIQKDFETSNTSLVCGGTGLYIKAIVEGLNTFPDIPQEVVVNIEKELKTHGLEILQKRLYAADPVYYNTVDLNNSHRLIRALSVIDHTQKTFSSFIGQPLKERPFEVIDIVLEMDRIKLYERINNRVLKMIEGGLIEEVKSLQNIRQLKALNTVGYSEVFDYLDNIISIEDCIEKIQTNSRQYAKRQLTWIRKHNNGRSFAPDNLSEIMDYIKMRVSR
jgi:tRNA dimethylallyltransferase